MTPTKTPKKPPTSTGSEEYLHCNLCNLDAWKGSLCSQCDLYRKNHYAEGVGATENVDFFCVAESPHIAGPSTDLQKHATWNFDAEKIVKNAFVSYIRLDEQARQLNGRYTFAVRCDVKKPKKSVQKCCFPLFQEDLSRANPEGPILIFALGPSVLQTFGLKLGRYSDVQGQFIRAQLGDRRVLLFPSLSKRQLVAKSGYYEVLKQHVRIFLDAVIQMANGQTVKSVVAPTPMRELTKHYIFPKTILEVHKLVEMVINYAPPGKDPENQPIAIDTETNTLNPHRKKLKILNLLVAWAPGKSAAIPIDHDECTWTYEEVFPHVERLLMCNKPKIFHNAKFDLKVLWRRGWEVNRFSWDTMIGEHLLAEDKRGFYGLKSLTKIFMPKYAGYEDELDIIKKKAQDAKEAAPGLTELKGAARKWADDDGYAVIPLKPLNEYGAVDADVTRMLSAIQRSRMAREMSELTARRCRFHDSEYGKQIAAPGNPIPNPLTSIMYRRLVPLTRILAKMELHGMAVDTEYLDDLAFEMDEALIQSKIKLLAMANIGFPDGFNPASPDQLRQAFFTIGYTHPDTKKIISYDGNNPELERTEGGAISTNARFLRKLVTQSDCPFAREVLQFRAIAKARTTFVENIRVLSQEDGRMHTSFHLQGTSTGRLSSSNENMQNIPKRIGKHNLKKIFVPVDRENNIIVNADAKAAEVRIYAAYSRDENLIKALRDGMDPHSFFASTVYTPEAVLQGVLGTNRAIVLKTIGIDETHAWTYEDFQNRGALEKTDLWYGKQLGILRTNIKRVVFGILYGASKRKISAIVGIPDEQAQAIINVLFRMFPTIEQYIRLTKDQVHHLGMVETFIGRRRRFDLTGMTHYLKSKAERQAVNFKIQSTSSEIVMDVLCSVFEPLEDIGGKMLITVHDSLVFEIPKKNVGKVPAIIERYGVKEVAQRYPWLPVPFQWDIEVGSSYGELQSIESYLEANPFISKPADLQEVFEHEIRQEFQTVEN